MSKVPFFLISSGRFMGDLSMQRKQSELYGACLEKAECCGVLYSRGDALSLAKHFDGLILSGGGDIHPALFGQKCKSDKLSIDPVRDAEELALFEAFYSLRKPILGICRGMQVINVLLGGTLHQHIENHSNVCHEIANCGVLATLIGESAFVNSYHHQSVDKIADDLQIVSQSSDNVIEGLWHKDQPILGVQWHPERMVSSVCEDIANANHLPLFEWLKISA